MWPDWFVALLVMLKEAWSARRDAHIRLLKLQVEMLQARLPGNRVILDPVERRRLMKVGAEAGHAVEDTLGIVNIKTYRRWQREESGGREPGKVGRPRLAKSVCDLIGRMSLRPTARDIGERRPMVSPCKNSGGNAKRRGLLATALPLNTRGQPVLTGWPH